jgi:hypothetical protein
MIPALKADAQTVRSSPRREVRGEPLTLDGSEPEK